MSSAIVVTTLACLGRGVERMGSMRLRDIAFGRFRGKYIEVFRLCLQNRAASEVLTTESKASERERDFLFAHLLYITYNMQTVVAH